jgi:methionyl-tRNA formyltransferase
MLRIVFAGTPEFALPALDRLAGTAHALVGVLTQPDRPAGRGRVLTASPVKRRALQLGIPVAQPATLNSDVERETLVAWSPDLLVVVAYGLILPPPVLKLPRLGCLNIHASLLPRWRGAAPIQRALLAGDSETGVSIMQLEAGLDTGPVYLEQRIAIERGVNADKLQATLADLGADALIEVVAGLENGTACAVTQSPNGVTYASKVSKQEARIAWNQSALQIERQVNAFNPRPVAETYLEVERVRIWRAHALDSSRLSDAQMSAMPGTSLQTEPDALWIRCGEGVLAIEQLQLPGRRQVGAAEFIRARQSSGLRFQ